MLIKGLLLYAKIAFGIGFYMYSTNVLLLAVIALILCRLKVIRRFQERYL